MCKPNKLIFRRDFRVIDNIGLNLANSLCKHVYPIFIFTPEQVTSTNKFKSDNAIQFMNEKYQGQLPSLMSVVAGPSRTADIEKTLVLGAHGPRELFLFLIDDTQV